MTKRGGGGGDFLLSLKKQKLEGNTLLFFTHKIKPVNSHKCLLKSQVNQEVNGTARKIHRTVGEIDLNAKDIQ